MILHWALDFALGAVALAVGIGVTGSEVIGYLFGIGLLLAIISLGGLLIESRLQHRLARAVDAVLGRIPVVRGV